MREKELIVYKKFSKKEGRILRDMSCLMEHYREDEKKEKMEALLYRCVHGLLEMAGSHGFYGNLWHCYLTNLLVNNENSYSRACEIRGKVEGTINQAVLHDIVIFKEFYDYDFAPLEAYLGTDALALVMNYESGHRESRVYNRRIRERICELAVKFTKDHTPQEMKDYAHGVLQGLRRGAFWPAQGIPGGSRQTWRADRAHTEYRPCPSGRPGGIRDSQAQAH